MKQYFGIDIGGTAVKLGIVDETGKVLCKGEQSVNFDGYQTPVLDTVRKAAKEFLTAQAIPVENLSGIGVSATGQIDSRKGIVAGTCGNFPNYIGSPIKAALEQDFGLPVTVANDANCMTLGEVWVGGAQGYTDVIGVTLGTGVGGGILTGGRLLEGARGLGGELGHYRTHALDGVPCTCGATGCWERYAATTALVRAAQEKNPAWTDGRAIFAAAEAGNPEVLALLDAWTDEIAQGLLQAAGPALVLVEADAVVGAVVGVGAIAVGVGITQTENMLFHNQITPFPSSAGSSTQRPPSRRHCAAARHEFPALRQRRA